MLVLLITFYCRYLIWGCMYSTSPFQFRWFKGYICSSCYYHHQIRNINVTHYNHIFLWLCAWDVCFIIFCHLHLHSGKTRNLFSLLLCSLWWMQIVRYILVCQIYFVECVSKIWECSLNYPLYNIWGCHSVCLQFTHFTCDDWEYTLSYYHHQIWSMNYHPLLRVRSWMLCDVCLYFYGMFIIGFTLLMYTETWCPLVLLITNLLQFNKDMVDGSFCRPCSMAYSIYY